MAQAEKTPDAARIDGILETVLYVTDIDRAAVLYGDVLGLPVIFSDDRMRTYDVGGRGTLLLFVQGGTLRDVQTPFGTIPAHDARGCQHLAFAIAKDALEPWRDRLAARGIAIESRVDWPRGGVSLYFRDPDGHLLELATPGLWPGY